jgi:hypothetical protein
MNATRFYLQLGYPQAGLCCVTLNMCGLFTIRQVSDDSILHLNLLTII